MLFTRKYSKSCGCRRRRRLPLSVISSLSSPFTERRRIPSGLSRRRAKPPSTFTSRQIWMRWAFFSSSSAPQWWKHDTRGDMLISPPIPERRYYIHWSEGCEGVKRSAFRAHALKMSREDKAIWAALCLPAGMFVEKWSHRCQPRREGERIWVSSDHRFIFMCNMIILLAFVGLFSSRSATRTFSTGAFRTVSL